jgi:hypothetical protein
VYKTKKRKEEEKKSRIYMTFENIIINKAHIMYSQPRNIHVPPLIACAAYK